jgi:hypothetical protein
MCDGDDMKTAAGFLLLIGSASVSVWAVDGPPPGGESMGPPPEAVEAYNNMTKELIHTPPFPSYKSLGVSINSGKAQGEINIDSPLSKVLSMNEKKQVPESEIFDGV